jgi:hypothetical protein
LDKNHEQHYQESIEFIEEHTDLCYPQTEDINWPTYENLAGYDLWHHSLGHVLNRNIEQTSQHSIGLENLVGKKCKRDQKCPSCMLWKSALENYQGSMDPASQSIAGCAWICIHYPSHQLKDITILSSSLTATVE